MKSRPRRRTAVVGVLALVSSMTAVLLGSSVASAVSNINSCTNNFTPDIQLIDIDFTGTAAPDPATLGVDTVDTTGVVWTMSFPGDVVVLGYPGAGLVAGLNVMDFTVAPKITASNTAEGSYTLPSTFVQASTTITDLDGDPDTKGDNSATDLVVTVPIPNRTWTPTGGNIAFADGGGTYAIDLGLNFVYTCNSGTPTPFETVTVISPPAPPVANDDGPGVGPWGSAFVGGGQSVTINILANDTDQNSDIDPSSIVITHAGAGVTGDVTDLGGGNIQYTNLDPNVGIDSFTYTVEDLGGNGPSNTATVQIEVLGAFCTAAPECSLDQVLTLPIQGASLSMEQSQTGFNPDANNVILGSCTGTPFVLDGQAQVACGQYNDIVVINALGTDADWAVTATTTDLTDGTVADCSTPSNHCIPAGNVGMIPFAQGDHPLGALFGGPYGVIHTVIAGDVALYVAGSPVLPAPAPGGVADTGAGSSPGLTLCSAPTGQSGGTYRCGASVLIGVPASSAAGIFVGTTTFTLA